MIDFIKCIDLAVPVDELLVSDRLRFPLPVDERTGEVIDQPRWAFERGLFFTLTPSKVEQRLRCELKGSLHRYHNDGRHNADAFTVAGLLDTLDELITTYRIDPFTSRLNNIEFGLNLSLPFPVARVFDNLISFKNRAFTREPGEGFTYYQCHTQRYILKLYDKGAQYRSSVGGLPDNLLRIEIKVLKMAYLAQQGITLFTMADLLDMRQYARLGSLLMNTFSDILFDEPSLAVTSLKAKEHTLYQNGRNPRYWQERSDQLQLLVSEPGEVEQRRQYNAARQRLHAEEKRFRRLVDRHRPATNWITQLTDLLASSWKRLTQVSPELQHIIDDRQATWQSVFQRQLMTNGSEQKPNKLTGYPAEKPNKLTGVADKVSSQKPNKLTGVDIPLIHRETLSVDTKEPNKLTGLEKTKTSQINPLSIGLICEHSPVCLIPPFPARGTSSGEGNLALPAPVEGEDLLTTSARASERGESDDKNVSDSPSIRGERASVRSSKRMPRICPITALDITHQRADVRLASRMTFQQLARRDVARFELLCQSLLSAQDQQATGSARCFLLAETIRKLAVQWNM